MLRPSSGPEQVPFPKKPPVEGLIPLGITASMDDINSRVEEVTQGHLNMFGIKPPPGLVFDVVRGWSQGKVKDVPSLFDMARNASEARVRAIARQAPPIPEIDPRIAQYKADMARGTMAPLPITPIEKRMRAQGIPIESPSAYAQLAGFAPKNGNWGLLGKTLSQIAEGLVNSFPGMYQLAKAGVLDARDFGFIHIDKPLGLVDDKFLRENQARTNRTTGLAGGMGKAVVGDVLHPLDNPGYLLMDAWALLSFGAGATARAGSAAGRFSEYAARERVPEGRISIVSPGGEEAGNYVTKEYLALHEGRPIGRLSIGQMEGDAWTVLKASVHPAFQKGGIATEMFKKAKADHPELVHSHLLSRAGKAFKKSTDSPPGSAIIIPSREQLLQAVEGFRKPDHPDDFVLGWGPMAEPISAFNNAALRAMQGWYINGVEVPGLSHLAPKLSEGLSKGAQGRLIERQFHGIDSQPIRDQLFSLLSTENLLYRQRTNTAAIQYAIATAPLIEMDRLTNWIARTQSILESNQTLRAMVDEVKGAPARGPIAKTTRAEQKFGLDKALQIIFSDDHDPITAWRSFHQRMIDDLQGQKVEFDAHSMEEAQALREAHDFHRQNVTDLLAQRAELEAGTLSVMPRSELEEIARYEMADSPSIRQLARDLTAYGFDSERVKVRERKNGLLVLADERAHELVAAARYAGIDDLPVQTLTVGDKELRSLRQAAREQAGIANKIKPSMKKAEAIMGLGEKERLRQHDEFGYKVASHEGQLAAIDLAEKILENPPRRLKAIVDLAYRISDEQEKLKEIVWGLDPAIGEQHLAEIMAIVRGEKLVPILDENGNATGRLGRVIEGMKSDAQLAKDVREGEKALRAAQGRRDTLKMALNRPTKAGKKAWSRPKVQEKYEEADLAVERAESRLELAMRAKETQGSRVLPLERSVTGRNEGNHASVYVNRRTGEIVWGDAGEHHESLLVKMGYHREADSLLRGEEAAATGVFDRLQDAYTRADREGWDQAAVNFDGSEVRVMSPEGRELPADFQAQAEKHYAAPTNVLKLREGKGSAYSGPMQREIYRDAGVTKGGVPTQRGRFGRRRPTDDTTSKVRMDGSAIHIGDFRWDTPNLLSSELRGAWRGAFAMAHYQDLWSIGKKERIYGEHSMAIRDIQGVPDKLRKVVRALENRVIDPEAAAYLTEENLDALKKYLYPDVSELPTDDPHLRWVDERNAMGAMSGDQLEFWKNADDYMNNPVFKAINEPWRLLVIFGSPAYLLNAGGAAVTLWVEHGPASHGLLSRSWAAEELYGGENKRLFDQLAGSTHASALVTETGSWTKGSQAFYRFWQKFTDQSFRRAALIGNLQKRGLLHDGMSHEEVNAMLRSGLEPMMQRLKKPGEGPDQEGVAERIAMGREVILAAKDTRKQMLDFDKMTWPERAMLRHIVFVYAFLRAGSIWSLRFMGEHPVKWGISAQAGRDRAKEIEQVIGKVPSWFNRTGFMPFDNNTVMNPVQFNMPGVLSQLLYTAQSLVNDAPYANVGDLLGPLGILSQDITSGKTQQGQNLPKLDVPGGHGRFAGSFLDLLQQTPPGFAVQRDQKLRKQQKLTMPPPAVRIPEFHPGEGAAGRERSFLNLNSFELDGFWNNWGRLIARTADPIDVNNLALQARYWRDVRTTDPAAYADHQLALAKEVVQRQAGILGATGVPSGVNHALEIVAAREAYIEEWKTQKGIPQPGDRQLAVLTIGFLKKQGIITQSQANGYAKEMSKLHGAAAFRGLWIRVLHENGTLPWAEWGSRVNTVNQMNTDTYTTAVKNLGEATLGGYSKSLNAPPQTKWGYGRKYLDYVEKRSKLLAEAHAAPDSYARSNIVEQLRKLDNGASNEVAVDGVAFPSFQAFKFGRLTDPEARSRYVAHVAVSPWASQIDFNRELLTGKKTDPNVVEAYKIVAGWMQDRYDQLKPGEHVEGGLRAFYIKSLIDRSKKTNPAVSQALADDISFSKQPLGERIRVMTPIVASRYKAQWDYLLNGAQSFAQTWIAAGWTDKKGTPKYSDITKGWQNDGVPEAEAWIAKQGPGFRAEVERFESVRNHFLRDLVRP